MATLQTLTVKESKEQLTKFITRSSHSTRPRLKMLLAIVNGTTSTNELALKTKSNRDSIRKWKHIYRSQGLQALLEEGRGGRRHGGLNEQQKAELQKRLSNPKEGFTSYKQAAEWISKTFGLQMNYDAVRKYLKRNFSTKFKVGRKTHVNQDPDSKEFFKNPVGPTETY